MSNMVKTLLTLHLKLGKPMSKSSVLSICWVIELIKCVQYTFHRQVITVADHLLLTINHYELALLANLQASSVSLQYSWTHLTISFQGFTVRFWKIIIATNFLAHLYGLTIIRYHFCSVNLIISEVLIQLNVILLFNRKKIQMARTQKGYLERSLVSHTSLTLLQ